jgi:hypothetical protein
MLDSGVVIFVFYLKKEERLFESECSGVFTRFNDKTYRQGIENESKRIIVRI